MADKKISQLIPGTTLVGTEPIPMVQGGQTVATTPNAISALIKPYKVYTALLTQSGGDDPLEVNGVGSLVKGVTYTILENNTPIDLSSFGAPNNNVGTTFCSTLTGPINGDGPDSVILSYNTGAPVTTVLENTIGNIWFTYTGVGDYLINSNTLFTINKTIQFLNSILVEEGCLSVNNYTDGNLIYLSSQSGGFDRVDGYFNNTPIEIRVYL